MSRTFLAFSLAFLCAPAARGAAVPPSKPVAAILDNAKPETRRMAEAGIAALGGRVLHALDDVLVVELPPGRELLATRVAGVYALALNAVPVSARKGSPSPYGIAAWNAIAVGPKPLADTPEVEPAPLIDDALTPPSVSLEAVRLSRGPGALPSGSAPYGATALNTSEFLAGAVSVNIVLVESDGTIDLQSENWSASRENDVVARIAAGLEWVREQEPQSTLHFVYHVYPGRTDARARTGYEPIRHAADPTGVSGEDKWVGEVLKKLGYASGDRFARARAFDADTRSADGTDWAVTVFVVDSLADPDGKFADGRFAYTWIGGPHVIMTYDNQAWGISRMDMVFRHEILHAFYAFDEYAASGCACADHRGYLDGRNTNCEACNTAAAPCVMITNGDAMCPSTRRQIGWADLDGDGTIDVVGEDPDTFLDPVPAQVCAPPVVTGVASVVAATNRNLFPGTTHPSISINRISGAEVSVDGAAWQAATIASGAAQSRFTATLPGLPPGAHRLEVRAVDDHGNLDRAPGSADVVVEPTLEPLGDSVRASRTGAAGIEMTWTACLGAKRYRVYRRPSPQGEGILVAETSTTLWTMADASNGYYQVVPVDACGGER